MIKTYLLPSLHPKGWTCPILNCCFSFVGEQVCITFLDCAIMETVTLLSEYFHPSVINVYLWISSFSLSSVPPPSTKLGDEAGKRLAWQCQPHPHDLLPRGAIPSRDLLQNNRETFLQRTFITSSSSPCNAVGYNQLFLKYSFLIGANQAITPALLSSAISSSSIPTSANCY